jgi:hypothetical protein
MVGRSSVCCTFFTQDIKYLPIVVHTSSSALKLKKFAVRARFDGYYDLNSTICFDVGMRWKISARALVFTNKIAVPHAKIISSIKHLHYDLIGMYRSKVKTK